MSSRAAYHREYYNLGLPPIKIAKCKNCSGVFTPRQRDQLYCSKLCKSRASNKRARARRRAMNV